jgi:hypothetical protein
MTAPRAVSSSWLSGGTTETLGPSMSNDGCANPPVCRNSLILSVLLEILNTSSDRVGEAILIVAGLDSDADRQRLCFFLSPDLTHYLDLECEDSNKQILKSTSQILVGCWNALGVAFTEGDAHS